MRNLSFIILFFTSASFAQGAADKDAIDLSAKMDTVERSHDGQNPVLNLNIGLKNTDEFEDFEIGFIDQNSRIHFGGPLIFNSTSNLKVGGLPNAYADLDGDGIGDMITDNFYWYKGKKDSPYFDSNANATLEFFDFPARRIFGGIDYNRDGINDVLMAADNYQSYILFYAGSSHFGDSGKVYPSDSIIVTPRPKIWRGFTIGKFAPSHPEMIVFASDFNNGQYRIGFLRHNVPLHEDTLIWLSNSDSGGISVQNLCATDITGDGIADLLVSDGMNVYIFKGGDDFGTYPLTPKNAYYRIKSPRLLDFGNFGFLKNFGSWRIRACGDLTGSGIPYLMVTAEIDESSLYKSFAFFYAGGKALDSLFDAVVAYQNNSPFELDTLHSINSQGRTACLLMNYESINLDMLLFRDCDKIPHKTNPQMLTQIDDKSELLPLILQATVGGGFVSLVISGESSGEHQLTIYNMLGEEVAHRTIGYISGKQTEQFTTSEFADGTYIAVLRWERGYCTVKFPVNGIMRDQAPESPLLFEMHESIPAVNGLR